MRKVNQLRQIGISLGAARQAFTLWTRVCAILNEAGSRLAIGVVVATLAEAGFSLAALYATKLLVDALGAGLANPSAASGIYLSLALAGAALVASVLAQSVANYLRTEQGLIVSDVVDRLIHSRSIAVDLSFYESPLYFDSLQRAREAGAQRPAQLVSNLLTVLRSVIVLGTILVMLVAIEWRLLPVLAATVGLALVVRLHFTHRTFAWRMARAHMERRTSYLDWLLTSNIHAQELRLNALGAHLSSIYSDLRLKIRSEHLSLERRRLIAELGVAACAALVFIAVAAWLTTQALAGLLTIGQVVLFILLLRRAEGAGGEMISGVSRLVDDHLYLARLFAFLDIEPRIRSIGGPRPLPAPLREGLRMESVFFTYPGADHPAVRDLSLDLRPGQIVAIVGENGSGKTTLIKLLTRLYDPTSGAITLDGTDIRAFDPVDYRKVFSVIFQEFAMYPETVTDNIRFGDVHIRDGAERARDAARRAGADSFIATLPNGYDTPLTKIFDDGHDLSLGQWQRVALSRSLFPASQFVIMDEPTSAMDPAAEFELFENFRERLNGRGAVIISHRLSTVRQADFCYVLDKGRIVECGTHADLIAHDGIYATLFARQAQHYR